MINKNPISKFVFKASNDAHMVLRVTHNNLNVLDTFNDSQDFSDITVILTDKTVKLVYSNGNSEVLLIKNINYLILAEFNRIFHKKRILIQNGKLKQFSVENYFKPTASIDYSDYADHKLKISEYSDEIGGR